MAGGDLTWPLTIAFSPPQHNHREAHQQTVRPQIDCTRWNPVGMTVGVIGPMYIYASSSSSALTMIFRRRQRNGINGENRPTFFFLLLTAKPLTMTHICIRIKLTRRKRRCFFSPHLMFLTMKYCIWSYWMIF